MDNGYSHGAIGGVCTKLDEMSIEITDLLIGTRTQHHEENVLEIASFKTKLYWTNKSSL